VTSTGTRRNLRATGVCTRSSSGARWAGSAGRRPVEDANSTRYEGLYPVMTEENDMAMMYRPHIVSLVILSSFGEITP